MELGQPPAAVLQRPGDAEQPRPVEPVAPVTGEGVGLGSGKTADPLPVIGKVRSQERAHPGPELRRLRRIPELHRTPLRHRNRGRRNRDDIIYIF